MRRAAAFLVLLGLLTSCRATPADDRPDPIAAALERARGKANLAEQLRLATEWTHPGPGCYLTSAYPQPDIDGVVEAVDGPAIAIRCPDAPREEVVGPIRFDVYLGNVYKGAAIELERVDGVSICYLVTDVPRQEIRPGDLATTRL